MITPGFLASNDCTPEVFWSAWSASEESAMAVFTSLPSTPPAALTSLTASLNAATVSGPRYDRLPVSGKKPPSINAPESAEDEPDDEDAPEPQAARPDRPNAAAANSAVARIVAVRAERWRRMRAWWCLRLNRSLSGLDAWPASWPAAVLFIACPVSVNPVMIASFLLLPKQSASPGTGIKLMPELVLELGLAFEPMRIIGIKRTPHR